MSWYIKVLKKYAEFNGRARRKEYWMFTLINVIISFGIVFIGVIFGSISGNDFTGGAFGVIYFLYVLAVLIPGLAVTVRRLHDTGRSGWWFLIGLVPFVGTIILLVFMVMDSDPGENIYGANPKNVTI